MILVTVGTYNRGFDRLVHAADEMAPQLSEPVIIQYGSTTYEPRHASLSFRFTTGQEMEELTLQARVIVMHAAAGSLILALQLGKPLVVVPRLRKYQEHIDDHQIQLATALQNQNRAIVVMEPSAEGLFQAVALAVNFKFQPLDNSQLVTSLRQQLVDWDKSRRLS